MAEAFARYVGADVLATAGDAAALAAAAGSRLRDAETWEDLFFRLLLERIEPHLGREHPTFLTHWPAAQAALARRDPADPGLPSGSSCSSAASSWRMPSSNSPTPAEQRARFIADRARRHAYGAGLATG